MATSPTRMRKTRTSAPPPLEVDDDDAMGVSAEEADLQRQIQSDVQALLDEMQTSFKEFSDTIFTKVDGMQNKIGELQGNVDSLSASAPQNAVGESPAVRTGGDAADDGGNIGHGVNGDPPEDMGMA